LSQNISKFCINTHLDLQDGIPFLIFERDSEIDARSPGWGITIHWALRSLKQCLPDDLFEGLASIQVDPEQGRNDTGRFVFLDLEKAEPRFIIPPSHRIRVSRKKFRQLLLRGLDVQWGKSIESVAETSSDTVTVTFKDGTTVSGGLVVGADGSGSATRRFLCPENGALNQLPARFIGVTVRLSAAQVVPLRAIDPLLFLGCHPETGAFLWFSMLSTPEVNGSEGEEQYYEGQINVSWLYRGPEDEVPTTDSERLAKMRHLGTGMHPVLMTLFEDIPDDSEVTEIKLADWPCYEWPNLAGKITLIGDAAHAMTMYRGEAANHGITDVVHLHDKLLAVVRGELTQREAVEEYEKEMRARTHPAVLLSRQACLDAHDFKALDSNSPLVSKRAIVPEPARSIKV
jgi:2-polyprenyl-6-methoxyphenol hydroxylase-like FAD-dependent oxidoreductase